MVTVRRAERQVRDVALPSVRFSPIGPSRLDTARAQDVQRLGRAVGGLGAKLVQVEARKEREEAKKAKISKTRLDKAVAGEQVNAYRAEWRQYNLGISQLKGKDLIDATVKAEEFSETLRKKYGENIKNPEVKNWFLPSADAIANGHLNEITRRQQKGIEQYQNDVKKAESINEIRDAVASDDPKAVGEAEVFIRANAKTLSQREGDKPEVTKKKMNDATHALYMAKLDSLTAVSPLLALNFLEKNKDKINPIVYEQIKKDISASGDREWARDKVEELASSGLPFDKQLVEADKIKDVNRAEKVKRGLKNKETEKQESKKIRNREIIESEIDKIYDNPDTYVVPYDRLDAPTQEKLEAVQRRKQQDARAKRGIGSTPKTDPKTYYELTNMSPDDFKNANLLDFAGKLSTAHLTKFMDMQKNDSDYSAVQTKNSYVNQFVKSERLEKPKDFAKASFFRDMFEQELNKFPKADREKIETWNKIKDVMVLEMDIGGTFFDFPYWEAKYRGDKILEPDVRPEGIPDIAKWVDQMSKDGVIYRGYEFVNPEGVKFLYGTDGVRYRVD